MALYYVLLNGWMELGSDEAVFVRCLSGVFAVAAVPMTILFARRAFGWPAAGIAGSVLALSGPVVVYGQEARTYALVLLLAPLCFLFFLHAVRRGGTREWALYTFTAAALVYAHNLSVFLLVAQFASLSLLPAVDARWRHATRSIGGLVVLCSPLALGAFGGEESYPWVFNQLSIWQLGDAAKSLAGGLLLVFGFGVLFALAVRRFAVVLRRSGRSDDAWIMGLVLLWVVVPPALLAAISVVKGLFVYKYVIGIMPGIAVMAGAVVAGLRPRGVAWAAAGLLMATMLGQVATREKSPPAGKYEDPRALASLVVNNARPGDGVAYTPTWIRLSVDYYLDRLSRSGTSAVSDVGLRRGSTPIRTGDVLPEEASAAVVERRILRSGRIWLVTVPGTPWHISPDPVGEVGLALLESHFVGRGSWDFGPGVRLTLYERRTGHSGAPRQ
jgi:mannosyltransferase